MGASVSRALPRGVHGPFDLRRSSLLPRSIDTSYFYAADRGRKTLYRGCVRVRVCVRDLGYLSLSLSLPHCVPPGEHEASARNLLSLPRARTITEENLAK